MANTYYRHTIAGVRFEHYAFFDGGGSVVILEDDTQYKVTVNTRTETEVQGFADSITEAQYLTVVSDLEDFARIGGHPPSKPPAA